MAQAKQMVGARALIFVDNQLVGVFDSINYSVNIGNEPSFILGRMSAAEIPLTSYEPVRVDCSGLRVIGNGPGVLPKFPKLQDLLSLGEISITVMDRQSNKGDKPIDHIKGCKPITKGISYQAKQSTKFTISYIGLVAEDESGDQAEPSSAATF